MTFAAKSRKVFSDIVVVFKKKKNSDKAHVMYVTVQHVLKYPRQREGLKSLEDYVKDLYYLY